jgi:hypothetical protein
MVSSAKMKRNDGAQGTDSDTQDNNELSAVGNYQFGKQIPCSRLLMFNKVQSFQVCDQSMLHVGL